MYLKEFRLPQHSYVSKVTIFGPFFGPSDKTIHLRNITLLCMTELFKIDVLLRAQLGRVT